MISNSLSGHGVIEITGGLGSLGGGGGGSGGRLVNKSLSAKFQSQQDDVDGL